jgi:hypothetical protein
MKTELWDQLLEFGQRLAAIEIAATYVSRTRVRKTVAGDGQSVSEFGGQNACADSTPIHGPHL